MGSLLGALIQFFLLGGQAEGGEVKSLRPSNSGPAWKAKFPRLQFNNQKAEIQNPHPIPLKSDVARVKLLKGSLIHAQPVVQQIE